MGNIERWYAAEGDGVPWVVMQDEGQMVTAIAECDTKAHAEMIARALNNQGAVDLLREIGAMAGAKANGADARAMAKRARDWLAANGGQSHPGAL